MKMKLAQRLVIGYYKTKLRTIGLVSARKAAEEAFNIFCTPYDKGDKAKMPPVFREAERLEVDLNGQTIRGFRWHPAHPNGRKALIVHGFSSYSYKFEKYVPLLLQSGFEVLAFDAPGHGLSEGKHINALIYSKALLAIDAKYGPIHCYMAHSLGGLATSLTLEQLSPTIERKVALIAPATETKTAIAGFFKLFKVKEPVQQEFEGLVLEIAGKDMNHFSVTRAVQQYQYPILWIHDHQDMICPFKDTLPIRTLQLPHIQFVETQGLGHNKIYRDRHVMKQVIDFFSDQNR